MGLAVLVVLLALGTGALLGGRLSGLTRLPVRHLRLLAWAFGLYILAMPVGDPTVRQVLLLASTALAVRFAAAHRHIAGIPLAAAGLVLNTLVTVVNGGMPVSEQAAARAGAERTAGAGHIAAGADTRWDVLGEWIPVPLPVHPEVVGPGDVLVAAGVGLVVVYGMLLSPGTPPLTGLRHRLHDRLRAVAARARPARGVVPGR
ncbi:DUF5317 family protein [Yinghuangia sp. YIM S10712]|uniref:DUF5317 family protein n=1 Tax=Yinghuangia sp. YIM S10712 TaxID=3436930 RepID=UPI003F52C88D